MSNERILLISDLHAPYMHRDAVRFLAEVKRKWAPDRVILGGDEVDYHAASFHETDPDLSGASSELEAAIKQLAPLYKLFPSVEVLDSNHGSMAFRKQRAAGLPSKAIRSNREILDAPTGWRWHRDLTIKMSNGQQLYMTHGKSSIANKTSKNMSMCSAEFHFHSKFDISYWANPNGLYWGMHCGCLIDDKSLAFRYNKMDLDRPLLGVGLVIHGRPILLPMVLNSRGRWCGRL